MRRKLKRSRRVFSLLGGILGALFVVHGLAGGLVYPPGVLSLYCYCIGSSVMHLACCMLIMIPINV